MNAKRIALVVVLLIFVLGCSTDKPRVCGTWRMVEGTYVGPDFTVLTNEENRICYKILSDRHFSVIEMYPDNPDSNFFAAVGTYSLTDSVYIERYEASNIPSKMGEEFVFQSQVKDKTWKISLASEDMTLKETWVCVSELPIN